MPSRTEDVRKALWEARSRFPQFTRLSHYKGGTYIIVGHGFDTERQEVNIHYERRGGPGFDPNEEEGVVYDRPISLFTAERFIAIR